MFSLRPAPRSAAPLDCSQALAALPGLWSGALELADQRRLRAHLNGCAECRAQYVRESQTASAIARDGRVGRAEALRLARRRQLASLARAGRDPKPRLWVRTLVLPAFLIVLLARQTPRESFAQVEAQLGQYRLGERALLSGHRPQRLLRGDQVLTEETARVRLFDESGELTLSGAGGLVVESPAQRRYLLGAGKFEARGAHSFTTPWGVLELASGVLELDMGASGGRVELREGAAELTRAQGVCLLVPGEPVTLGAGL